jgi:hypothetical protein
MNAVTPALPSTPTSTTPIARSHVTDGPRAAELAARTSATEVVEDLALLLAEAQAGDTEALALARERFDALSAYLSAPENPLPRQWARALAWTPREPNTLLLVETPEVVVEHPLDDPTASTVQMAFDFAALDEEGCFTVTAPEGVLASQIEAISRHRAPIEATPVLDELLHEAPEPLPAPVPTAPATAPASRPHAISHVGPATSFAEVHAYVKERLGEPTGVVCPACERAAAIHDRTLSSSMAQALIVMFKAGEYENRAWFNMPKINHLWPSRDEAMLAYWGLIETHKEVDPSVTGRRGWWRLTSLGVEFVQRKVAVPGHAKVYNGRALEVCGAPVSITDALGTGFTYAEEMGRHNIDTRYWRPRALTA